MKHQKCTQNDIKIHVKKNCRPNILNVSWFPPPPGYAHVMMIFKICLLNILNYAATIKIMVYVGIGHTPWDNVQPRCADVPAHCIVCAVRSLRVLPVLLQGVHQPTTHWLFLLPRRAGAEPSTQVHSSLSARTASASALVSLPVIRLPRHRGRLYINK